MVVVVVGGMNDGDTMSYTSTTTIVFTGAPEAADYSQTKTLETFTVTAYGATKTWRKVEIIADSYRTAYQCDRYGSFLGGCATLDDPREVAYGRGRQAPSNY